MAEPTESNSSDEPVVVEPVAAAEHVGVEPVVPEVDDDVVVDDVPEPVTVEPVTVEPEYVEPVVVEPEVGEPAYVAPVAVAPVVTAPVVGAEDAAAAREVVYVQAPTPPPARHNRGFGVLVSLLGAVAFALLFIAVIAILAGIAGASVDGTLANFLQSMAFWVPVAVYAVISSLFALIVNRAAWWAHVLGSLFVAVLTYAISGGIVALALNVVGMTADEGVALLGQVFGSAQLIVALVLARETALWFGLAIAARGRKVKERNIAERAAFDQNVADRRAEYERAHPSA